jgi:hypothetical protein
MDTYEFTLFIDGDLSDDDTIGRLLAAGCDDASFGGSVEWGTADFHRQDHDITSAIISAITAVESAGLRVIAVQPFELVTMSTIAQRLDRTYESIRLLAAGQRGNGHFPRPADIPNIYGVKFWRWSDILEWAGTPDETASRAAWVISAVNAALELRVARARLDEREYKELQVALGV